MRRISSTWHRVAGCAAILLVAGCAARPVPGGVAGGGSLKPIGTKLGPALIEVRGYTLTPEQSVPENAIGYAVPVFTSSEQAIRFCPAFLKRLSFAGALDTNTKLMVRTYGRSVQVAPFVWPVTNWSAADRADCAGLVRRYNLSGARLFYTIALNAIRQGGGSPNALSGGPFIVTARRVSGTVMVFDLSRAPDNDYDKWLVRSVEQISNPALSGKTMVTPGWRDRMRYYVFGSVASFRPIIDVLIPGFSKEHDKS